MFFWMEFFREYRKCLPDARYKYFIKLVFGPTVNAAKGISVQVQNAVSAFVTIFKWHKILK